MNLKHFNTSYLLSDIIQVNFVLITFAHQFTLVHLGVRAEVVVLQFVLELLVIRLEHCCWGWVHFVVVVMAVVCPWQLVFVVVVCSMEAMVLFEWQHFDSDLPYLNCSDLHPNRKRNLVAMVAEDLLVSECTTKKKKNHGKFSKTKT